MTSRCHSAVSANETVPRPAAGSEVHDLDVAPGRRQVLGDEPAMAAMRLGLAAQQAGAIERDALERLNRAVTDQLVERERITFPVELALAVGVEQAGGRRERGLVPVRDPAQLAGEPREIVAFRESRELRRVVEP